MLTFKPKFYAEHLGSTTDSIVFKVHFNGIEPDIDSNIIINVYKQIIKESLSEQQFAKVGNLSLKYPIKDCYTLEDLSSGSNFRLNFFLTHGKDTYNTLLFANTLTDEKLEKKDKRAELEEDIKQSEKNKFSVTENLLYTYTDMKCSGLGVFNDTKDLKKNIIDARYSKKWKDYQNEGLKFSRPKYNRDTRKKRMWLIMNGMEVFEEVYGLVKNEEPGKKIMEGDWFMGPFYSYNNNLEKKF